MPDKDNSDYEVLLVDNNEKLLQLCEIIKDASILIIDTEFVREKTYRAKLCLIQIATDEIVACIDPIAVEDLSALMDIIYQDDKLKVLHAARQDYEIFFDLNGKLPSPLFDTQLAASLLGYGEQVGYAGLVNKVLNVQLDKAHTRTDWSKRPLSEAQLRYASDDVFYLRQLYPALKKQLIDLKRENWLDEEFSALCQNELFITHPEDAWKRVKGINRLRPRQLVAAKNIAKWREEVAIKKDRPRRWILADDILLAAAQLLPKGMKQLESIANIKKNIIENSGSKILEAVAQALALNDSELPKIEKPKRLSSQQEVIADIIMAQIRMFANEHQLSPSNIASRKMIEKLLLGDTNIELFKGWRKKLAGKKIQDFLDGKFSLQVADNKILLADT